MGCNCNKNVTRPWGMTAATAPSSPTTAAAPRGSTTQYTLRTAKGTTLYGSLLEAEAAKVRAGGGTITPV